MNRFQGSCLRRCCATASRRGFSLVETALALGVVSFALVSLMGLLSCGLVTFRKAMDFTLETQMTETLIAKARQTTYTGLSGLSGQTFYFDDNGDLVTAADPTATYAATVTITNPVGIPAAASGYTNNGVALMAITFKRSRAAATSPPLGTVVNFIAAMTGNSST